MTGAMSGHQRQQEREAGLQFHPMTADDIDWAWQVYTQTTQEHIEQVLDLTPTEQHDLRLEGLRKGDFVAVVDAQGERIGLMEVTDEPDSLTIRHLEVLPSRQGGGIGTELLRTVIARAAAASKTVTLRVLHVNPRARALYLRLGFAVIDERSRSTEMRLDPAALNR